MSRHARKRRYKLRRRENLLRFLQLVIDEVLNDPAVAAEVERRCINALIYGDPNIEVVHLRRELPAESIEARLGFFR